MRDDEIRRLLTEANPWWRAATTGLDPSAWVGSHRLLVDRAALDLGYRADVLNDVAAAPVIDRLVVLTGPRRVGKSVVLLDLAADLCRRPDLDPRQVAHIPCDGFAARDLRRALTLARDLTRVVDQPDPQRRVWLLDEVTAVTGWTSALKAARDGSSFGADTVVITGSRWAPGDDVEGNLLAGRAGGSDSRRVRHLLPMTFRSFVSATRQELALPPVTHPAHLQHSDVADLLDAYRFDVDGYDLAWQHYLTCGGFPRAVAEHTRVGAVSTAFVRDLAAWLRRDVDPDASIESIPLLVEGIANRATSPLNVRRTASDLGYGNDMFLIRLRRLVGSFAALWCPHRDDHGRSVRGSQSKLYLADPILAWLPSHLRAGSPEPDMTALTEAVLAVTLARAVDGLEEGRWATDDTIGYTRTGSGNEVDLAPVTVPSAAGTLRTTPIEAKWVDDRWRSDAKVIEARYHAGILATKSILDTTNAAWAIPAPLVALLLA